MPRDDPACSFRPHVIIDEAQHALSTDRGAETLFALKAARDALNLTASAPQLAIVATGSARGKIADMVVRRNQAFYGASVETFPPLGEAFVQQDANGFVWRSSRGVYALDDMTVAEFFYDDAIQDTLLRELEVPADPE